MKSHKFPALLWDAQSHAQQGIAAVSRNPTNFRYTQGGFTTLRELFEASKSLCVRRLLLAYYLFLWDMWDISHYIYNIS